MDVSVSERSHRTARPVGPRARSALKLQHLARNLPSIRAALRTLVLAVALCSVPSQVIGAPISIQCPADITTNASTGNCSGAASFAATATPASVCRLLGIAYGIGSTQITSPHTFPLGTTTVQAGAADNCNNVATCTFRVTVVDTQPPTITCPANITVNADSSRCTDSVSFAAAASDNCSVASLTYNMGAGSTPISSPYDFPVGTTNLTCTARDPSGNTASCTSQVSVRDTQPPGVTCSPDTTVSNDPGRCDASVIMRSLGSDNCTLASLRYYVGQTQISNPHAFPLGSTDVRTEVRDPSGNFSSCTFRVRVNDTEPPRITCPADKEAAAQSGQYSASLAFSAPASDNCRLASLGYFIGYTDTTLISSPYSFPVGETTVRAEARDASDNMASCAFRVTVRDTQPGNITGKVTNSSGAAFPGVSLSVFDQNYCDKAFAFNIDTIADGTYTIPNVPAGTYKVRFSPIWQSLS